ncbi:SGNH/GDSL hydrolase family protein [Fibrella sp. USSR17]
MHSILQIRISVRWLQLVCLVTLTIAGSYAQAPFPAGVRRVLFLGNSITYAGTYVSYVDAYLSTRYPQRGLEFINAGLPSETVSGLSEEGHANGRFPRPDLRERLARVLTLTKPDLVIASYGMNDGIYLPFDERRFQQFQDGINWLHSEVIKAGAQVIHLTPPVFDDMKGHKPGYAAVLDRYSDWLLDQKTAQNWAVIDVHYPMKQFLDNQRKADSTFALANDGVHPGELGHWLMAKNVLLGLGETAVADAPDIQTAMAPIPNAAQLVKLTIDRQTIMKDAWLTATGHKRPGMNVGLPLDQAKAKAAELDAQIKALLR